MTNNYTKSFNVIKLNGSIVPFAMVVHAQDYVDNYITNEISQPIPETNKIRIAFSTTALITGKSINTNNLVTSNDYDGITDPLAIKLYRQVYNLGNDRYDSILIPQDVRDVLSKTNPDGFLEFQCSRLTEQGIIEIFPIQSYLSNDDGISKHIPFWNNTTYKISINFNDMFDTNTLYTDDTMAFVGNYNPSNEYIVGDYVRIYDDPDVLAKYPWSSTTTYLVGDHVTFNGRLYASIQDGQGRSPDSESLYWKGIGSFFRCIYRTSDWDSEKLYHIGNTITYKAIRYKCKQNSIRNIPDANTDFWVEIGGTRLITDNYFWEKSTRDVVSFEFLTNEFSAEILNLHDNFSVYANNPLFKLNNIKWMNNISEVFNNTTIFDYKFTPVKLSSDNTYLAEIDSSNQEVMLKFDISSKLQDLYMNQYIPDYIPYFAALEAEKEWNLDVNAARLIETKIAVLSHSGLVNSFVKGVENGIKEIYGLFCSILGSFTFVIEKSPIHPNHVYRITSTLPKLYWYNYVKPVVHPLGWYEEYKLLTSNPKQPIINLPPKNTRMFYYKFKNLILQRKSKGISYLTTNNKPPFNRDTRFYDLIAIDDLNTTFNFTWKLNKYDVPENAYTSPELFAELDDDKLKIFMTTHDNMIRVFAEYRKTGIALKYEWTLYKDGVPWQSVQTHSNEFKSEVPISWMGHTISIGVILINDTIITNSNNRATFKYTPPQKTVTQVDGTSMNSWI